MYTSTGQTFLSHKMVPTFLHQALENRTKESKQEMDILEKLEELKDLNARHAQGTFLLCS